MRKPAKPTKKKEEQIDAFSSGADGDVAPKAGLPVGIRQNKRHTVQVRISDEIHQRLYNVRQDAKKLGMKWSLTDSLVIAIDNELAAMETEIERIQSIR